MSSQAGAPAHTLLLHVRLRVAPGVPAEARHATESVLGDVCPTARQSFVLLVSELVTNAVVHARKPEWLRVWRIDGRLRVEVTDGTRHRPVLRNPGACHAHGRGMMLVAALADDWGADDLPDGKVVWAELALRPFTS